VWLPSELARYTDEEGGLGQNVLKAISWKLFRNFGAHARVKSLLDEIWACLPAPDISILPNNPASGISYFAVDLQRFTATNLGLMKAVLGALAVVEQKGSSTVLNKIKYDRRSLSSRYSDNLPSRLESSGGFLRLKSVLNSTIASQR
jgi:hypothetical protein